MSTAEFLAAVEDFLQYLKLEAGLSSNSLTAYRADLSEFARSGSAKSPRTIKPIDISRHFDRLLLQGRRPATLARKLSSLRRFFQYLKENALIVDNPVGGYRTPRLTRYHPDYLSVEDIESILRAAEIDPRLCRRDRAIIELLYGCGLRISELINMKEADLEFEAGFVKVVGKGDKQRLVPIGQPACLAVAAYLEETDKVRAEDGGARTILVSRKGRPYSRVGLWKIVKKLVRRAGVAKAVTPHTFRHSFATHLLAGGADLRTVQEMLGHADISTTEVYTRIDQEYVVAEHRKHHPRELAGFRGRRKAAD